MTDCYEERDGYIKGIGVMMTQRSGSGVGETSLIGGAHYGREDSTKSEENEAIQLCKIHLPIFETKNRVESLN